MRRSQVSLCCLALALAGCKPEALPPDHARTLDGPIAVTRLRAEPYSFTYSSGLRAPVRRVIRDQESWREMWTAIWITHWPEPPLPAVDSGQEMIVVVALGERATGGYSILIESAVQRAGGISVSVRSSSPGPSCGTTAALTQPVDIARLPRSDVAVRFVEREESSDCR